MNVCVPDANQTKIYVGIGSTRASREASDALKVASRPSGLANSCDKNKYDTIE